MTDRNLDFIIELERIIAARSAASGSDSYTGKLLRGGVRRIAQKVGEEALEVALAAVDDDADALLDELADLVYHLLVLLRVRNMELADVSEHLRRRHLAG